MSGAVIASATVLSAAMGTTVVASTSVVAGALSHAVLAVTSGTIRWAAAKTYNTGRALVKKTRNLVHLTSSSLSSRSLC